jgi:hypothetical protein
MLLMWHVDPLPGNNREVSNYTTAVARQWLSRDHVVTQTDMNATICTETEERCRDVISRVM